jgi:hypothetical protein
MIFSSGQIPSENIITSENITPNPPRSGSINDNYLMKRFSKYLSLKIEILPIPLLQIRHILEFSEEVYPYIMTPLWTLLMLSIPRV